MAGSFLGFAGVGGEYDGGELSSARTTVAGVPHSAKLWTFGSPEYCTEIFCCIFGRDALCRLNLK